MFLERARKLGKNSTLEAVDSIACRACTCCIFCSIGKNKSKREKISVRGSAVAVSSCKKRPFPPGWKSREGRWIVQEAGEGRRGCIRTEGGARVVACIRGGRGGGRGGEGTGGIELYEMWAGACARSLLS